MKISFVLSTTIILIVVIFLCIYFAYFYVADENDSYTSEYLAKEDDKYITLSDFTAHYIVKGEGEPLVLIHGGGSWLFSYRNNIEELSKYYKVYAVDMPGHGYTTSNTEVKYDLDTYADFLKEFLDSQQISKARIVGHSWGGGWALYFTEKYPQMVSQLALLDSSGLDRPDQSEWKYFEYPMIGEIISKCINKNNTKNSLKKMFVDQSIITDSYVEEIYTPLSYQENRKAQVLAQRNLNWKITEENIEKVTQSTLIIFGDKDCYFDKKYQDELHSKLQKSKLIVIENTSHMPHEEKYEYIDSLLLEFFRENK